MKLKTLLPGLFIMIACAGVAQNGLQDSVAVCMREIAEGESDAAKFAASAKMAGFLERLEYGTYDTVRRVKYLGYKVCVNAGVELFSWSIPAGDRQAYYGLFKFEDGSNYFIRNEPGVATDVPSFLFYDLFSFTSDREEYFILLGWDRKRSTDVKAICVVDFRADGSVDFNVPLLSAGNRKGASYQLQYGRESSVMLKYDRRKKRILFDHVAPAEPRYEGLYGMYGPDGTYDAFVWKKGRWVLVENVKL